MEKIGSQRPSLHRILIIASAILAVVSSLTLVWIFTLPNPGELAQKYPVVTYDAVNDTTNVVLQNKKPPGWVSVKDVSKHAVGAIVVSEDWAFYQHEGFDANQIQKVIQKGIKTRKLHRGASTITQQVIKNVYLSPERSLKRKLQELVLAVLLEQRVSKSRILSIYLNIAEWGKGIYGINQAAHHYFYKHPRDLNAREGAFLAMLLPSPRKYSVSFRERNLTEYAAGIMKSILHKMVQARYMDSLNLDHALNNPMWFETTNPLWADKAEGDKEELIDDLKEALQSEETEVMDADPQTESDADSFFSEAESPPNDEPDSGESSQTGDDVAPREPLVETVDPPAAEETDAISD